MVFGLSLLITPFVHSNPFFGVPFDNPSSILNAVTSSLSTFSLVSGFMIVVEWFYFTALEASPLEATLGKYIFRIEVKALDGSELTVGQAVIRNLVKLFIWHILGLFCLLFFVGKQKKALHDLAAKTVVLNRP